VRSKEGKVRSKEGGSEVKGVESEEQGWGQ